MNEVVLALVRALRSLRNGKVLGYMLIPAAVSFLVAMGLAVTVLGWIVQQLIESPPMTLLAAWGPLWLAYALAYLGGSMAIFAVAYVCASLLAAIIIMPLLLKFLAEGDYRDVVPMGRDSFASAASNSVSASFYFVVVWLLTLPLWVIPGMSLILSLSLTGWLNGRSFAYDALSLHASDSEWQTLRRQHRKPLYMLGLTMALLAHIPFIGLLVPALAALSFVHYGLEALRRSRSEAAAGLEGEHL